MGSTWKDDDQQQDETKEDDASPVVVCCVLEVALKLHRFIPFPLAPLRATQQPAQPRFV